MSEQSSEQRSARAAALAIAIALASVIASCGGGDSRGIVPPPGGSAEEACNRACMCDPTLDVCSGECAYAAARWRQEARDWLVSCACDPPDAFVCVLEPRPIDTAFRDACLARRAECMNAWADDYCLVSGLFPDAAVNSAMACLSTSCDQVLACMRSAFEGT